MIAEPESAARDDLAGLLTGEGFVVVAQLDDGEQAVAMATNLRPDLLLMGAPCFRAGLTATAALTARRIALVLILASGDHPQSIVEQARAAGAMTAVPRPTIGANLYAAIELSLARFAEITLLEDQLAELTHYLTARKVIERAKGMLMTDRGITESEALRHLHCTAMDHETSLLHVAAAMINTPRGG
jgi:response regulator NasT